MRRPDLKSTHLLWTILRALPTPLSPQAILQAADCKCLLFTQSVNRYLLSTYYGPTQTWRSMLLEGGGTDLHRIS